MMLAKIFRFLMSIYPTSFQEEFGDEMQSVFTQALEEYSSQGRIKILHFLLREIKDLPGNLISQQRIASHADGSHMFDLPASNPLIDHCASAEKYQPGSWGDAILAGLPHLLVGILIARNKFFPDFGVYQLSKSSLDILSLCLGLLVVFTLMFAWQRNWPLWSSSWYGYGPVVLLVLGTYIISELDLHQSWRYTNNFLLSWLAVWGIGYIYLFFRDRLRALLGVFFFLPLFGVMILEFIPNPIEGWLAISLGLLTALTAATIVRLGSYGVAIRLVIGVNLVAALTLAYIGEYKISGLPAVYPPYTRKFSNFIELLALYTIAALILLGTPFLIQSVVHLGRRKFPSFR